MHSESPLCYHQTSLSAPQWAHRVISTCIKLILPPLLLYALHRTLHYMSVLPQCFDICSSSLLETSNNHQHTSAQPLLVLLVLELEIRMFCAHTILASLSGLLPPISDFHSSCQVLVLPWHFLGSKCQIGWMIPPVSESCLYVLSGTLFLLSRKVNQRLIFF